MMHLQLPILGEMYISHLMLIANWLLGWFIVERIRLWIKGEKTKFQWRKYYNDKFDSRQ